MTRRKSPAAAIVALLALAAAIGAGSACFASGGIAPLSHERLIELRALVEAAVAGGGEEALEDEEYGGSLVAEGKVPASLFREAERVLALLPDGLMGEFRARGWAIVLTSTRDLSAYVPGGGRIVGATVFDEKRIYIEADVAVVAESLLHEMGHFADMSLGWPSGGEAFLGAFEGERGAYAEADERGAGSAREAFAAVFNDICLERGCRERLAPRMFGAVRGATGSAFPPSSREGG